MAEGGVSIHMIENFGQANEALIQLIVARKQLEQEYSSKLAELSKWEKRVRLAIDKGNEYLAREALRQKKFYKNLVNQIQQQLESLERQINVAKKPVKSDEYLSDPLKILEIIDEISVDLIEPIRESKKAENEVKDKQVILLLEKLLEDTRNTITETRNIFQKRYIQYIQAENDIKNFHAQALEAISNGEQVLATNALLNESKSRQLLDDIKSQVNNYEATISLLENHLESLQQIKSIVESLLEFQVNSQTQYYLPDSSCNSIWDAEIEEMT
jgi:phage shock protein A